MNAFSQLTTNEIVFTSGGQTTNWVMQYMFCVRLLHFFLCVYLSRYLFHVLYCTNHT